MLYDHRRTNGRKLLFFEILYHVEYEAINSGCFLSVKQIVVENVIK